MNSCFLVYKVTFCTFFSPRSSRALVKQISGSVGNAVDCVEMQPWPWIRRISWWKSHGENDGKTSGWEVVRSTSTAIKAPEGKDLGCEVDICRKRHSKEKYLLFFSERMLVHRFMLAPFLWLWCGMYAMDLMDLMDLDSTCERDVGDVCLNVFLDWFMLIYVDLCPRWFPTQKLALASWRNYFGCGTRGTRLVGKLKSSLLSLC